MKTQFVKKLRIAGAVSFALLSVSTQVSAQETFVGAQVSDFQNNIIISGVFNDEMGTFAEAQLLTPLDSLPAECDPLSAFPQAEQHVDNPSDKLVGSWSSADGYVAIAYANEFDEDFEEDEGSDDDSEGGTDDDSEGGTGDDSEGGSDDDSEGGSDDDSEGDSDDDSEGGSDDDSEGGSDDEGNEDPDEDMFEDENISAYLTVSPSGYLVTSEMFTVEGVATCESIYIGELNGNQLTELANTSDTGGSDEGSDDGSGEDGSGD